MPSYTLQTTFATKDLDTFHGSGSNVIVAKPNGGGRPNVAWVAYKPLTANEMVWEEKYGIYASNTESSKAGARLTQVSSTGIPAAVGKLYSFGAAGYFGPPSPGGTAGSYTAVNEFSTKPLMTMGLYQDATVDGTAIKNSAVSAAPVPLNNTAQMTPFTTVYLWMQAQTVSNSVVTVVTSPQTEVRFGGTVTEVTLAYDADTGLFLPPSIEAAGRAGISVYHHEPMLG